MKRKCPNSSLQFLTSWPGSWTTLSLQTIKKLEERLQLHTIIYNLYVFVRLAWCLSSWQLVTNGTDFWNLLAFLHVSKSWNITDNTWPLLEQAVLRTGAKRLWRSYGLWKKHSKSLKHFGQFGSIIPLFDIIWMKDTKCCNILMERDTTAPHAGHDKNTMTVHPGILWSRYNCTIFNVHNVNVNCKQNSQFLIKYILDL